MNNPDKPAYPFIQQPSSLAIKQAEENLGDFGAKLFREQNTVNYRGLTKLEHVSTELLKGMLSNPELLNAEIMVGGKAEDVIKALVGVSLDAAKTHLQELDK